jgi:hypothetical protein
MMETELPLRRSMNKSVIVIGVAIRSTVRCVQRTSTHSPVHKPERFGTRLLARGTRGEIQRLEGRSGIIFVDGVQRIVGTVLVDRIKDIVVALVFSSKPDSAEADYRAGGSIRDHPWQLMRQIVSNGIE